MKGAVAVLTMVLAITICSASVSNAFEPTELLQWNQGLHFRSEPLLPEPRLRVEISERFYYLHEAPVQIGGKKSDSKAVHEPEIRLQYRFLENPTLGKFEGYLASSFPTHEDVYDRLDFVWELGYTFLDRIRIEYGHLRGLNVGRANPHREGRHGVSHYWIGSSVKLHQSKDLLVDVYGKYYTFANTRATNSTTTVRDETAIKGEVGSRVYYRFLSHLILWGAPYALFDGGVERVGVIPGLRYNIGEHWKFIPKGISIEASANLAKNISKKDPTENAAWFRIMWEFR